MTIHIDTDHGPIPPYAVMLIISFIAGLGVQFLLNARSGVKKSIAGYGTILAPPMAAFFAILVMQIYTGGKGIGVSSVGGALGMYMSAFTMALISRDRSCGRSRVHAQLIRHNTVIPEHGSQSRVLFYLPCQRWAGRFLKCLKKIDFSSLPPEETVEKHSVVCYNMVSSCDYLKDRGRSIWQNSMWT